MITFEEATKTFGDVVGVKDLSFSVGSGEVVGLLGANGAGKTTTMRLMTGYYPPTRGSVKLFGQDLRRDPLGSKKRLGYLPETPPLHDEMIVTNYLTYVARMKRMPANQIESRKNSVLTRLDLQEQKRRLIGNLSRGYRQRVALAQALIHDPDLLVLDEPTLGLDPKQVRQFRSLIEELARDTTLIISSHILPEIRQICERVIILNRGQIVAIDSPQKLAQKIQRGQDWELRISHTPEQWRDRMLGVEGIEEVNEITEGAYQISFQSGEMQNREKLFQLCREENVPIVRLSPTQLELEEVFLEYTQEEPAPSDAAEEPPGNSTESTGQETGEAKQEGSSQTSPKSTREG